MTTCRWCDREIAENPGDAIALPFWFHVDNDHVQCGRDHLLKRAEPSHGSGLDFIVDQERKVRAIAEHLRETMQMRDDMIRDELRLGTKPAKIAELADISLPRIYQIRDGRR